MMMTSRRSIARALVRMRDYWAYYVGSAFGLVVAQIRNELLARRGGRERGTMNRNHVFGIMFLITCVALIFSGYLNGQSAANLDRAVAQSKQNEARFMCQQRVLEKQIDALKARSGFAEQTRRVQIDFAEQFLNSLNLLLDDKATDEERGGSIVALRDAVRVELRALVEQNETSVKNDYPAQEAIERCRTLS